MRYLLLAVGLFALVSSKPVEENSARRKIGLLWSGHREKVEIKEYKQAVEAIVENMKIVKDKRFNMRDPEMRERTIEIFKFLHAIQDPMALAEIAEFLSSALDPEQFTYIMGVLSTHRADLQYVFPPWYEVHPNYFIPETVLKRLKAKEKTPIDLPEVKTDGIDYFREDVGLNHMFYNWMLLWPSWVNRSSYGSYDWDRRGELFYYYHEQLQARYNIERIGADVRSIIRTSWMDEIEGFESGLVDIHGKRMTPRPAGVIPAGVEGGDGLLATQEKLMKVATDGVIVGKDGSSVKMSELGLKAVAALGDIMFNTSGSYNPAYYGSFYDQAISLLASAGTKDNEEGGAIGTPMTALRDPAFYKLLNRIVSIVQAYKRTLPPYSKAELSFPGVKLNTFVTDPVETFFDDFEFDAAQAVGQTEAGAQYIVRQKRLNHTPLRVTLNVTNTNGEEKGAMIRIFYGPFHHIHSQGISFDASRTMFFELDRFPMKLKVGDNIIKRNDEEFTNIVDESYDGKKFIDCGFPRRLVVPRGTEGGVKFMMYAVISPYDYHETGHGDVNTKNLVSCGGASFDDGKAMGFPFDRPVRSYMDWIADNHDAGVLTVRHRSS